jgi:hypothetical protein
MKNINCQSKQLQQVILFVARETLNMPTSHHRKRSLKGTNFVLEVENEIPERAKVQRKKRNWI